jgi:hypothetical protein
MIILPSKTYFLTEESSALQILEMLGVVLETDSEGKQAVELDPILMIALLALQGKVMPTVSSLIERWRNQEENPTEELIEKGD